MRGMRPHRCAHWAGPWHGRGGRGGEVQSGCWREAPRLSFARTTLFARTTALAPQSSPITAPSLPQAEEDWTRDCRGLDGLPCDYFKDAIFELADLYTDSIDASAYAQFLTEVFKCIATQVPSDDDDWVFEWKADAEIMFSGFEPIASGGDDDDDDGADDDDAESSNGSNEVGDGGSSDEVEGGVGGSGACAAGGNAGGGVCDCEGGSIGVGSGVGGVGGGDRESSVRHCLERPMRRAQPVSASRAPHSKARGATESKACGEANLAAHSGIVSRRVNRAGKSGAGERYGDDALSAPRAFTGRAAHPAAADALRRGRAKSSAEGRGQQECGRCTFIDPSSFNFPVDSF